MARLLVVLFVCLIGLGGGWLATSATGGSNAIEAERSPAVLSIDEPGLVKVLPGPIVANGRVNDLDLSLVIDPGVAGINDINFYMLDTDRDWREVRNFLVRFTYLDTPLPSAEVDAEQLHEGHFPLYSYRLALAGHWRADARVVREGSEDATFIFNFLLPHR